MQNKFTMYNHTNTEIAAQIHNVNDLCKPDGPRELKRWSSKG